MISGSKLQLGSVNNPKNNTLKTTSGSLPLFFNMLTLPRILLIGLSLIAPVVLHAEAPPPPNVILIMTDDQGFGDYGVMGNPVLDTPNLDHLAGQSASMSNFYVSPVCSPTRASLMTGRYNYRTKVVDTFKGRSMMAPEEYTLAEALADAGYATGIFGKWHLGDAYPLRASDQGFQESFIHLGGGLAQPSEPIENQRRYTNPILFHNNEPVETRGYCTDLFFEAATQFIDQSIGAKRPFFAYIAPNAPHGPFHDVPEALYQKYLKKNLGSIMLDDAVSRDDVARIFAMIENVDANIGRLMDQLERRGIARDTIVIFLNDNGPNSRRFVGLYRGKKSEVHDGGVRSPLWVRWPARLKPGATSDRVSAHYDIMPTILEATGATFPRDVTLDGLSLLPLLEEKPINWPDRDLYLQSHRGDEPVPGHNMMVRNQRWKLLRSSGFGVEQPKSDVPFELYDVANDPGETLNVALEHPDIVEAMHQRYLAWFQDVSATRPDNFAPPRMRIGHAPNQQLILSSQDRRETPTGYEWHLQIDQAGTYAIELQWAAPSPATQIQFQADTQTLSASIDTGATGHEFDRITLSSGPLNLQMTVSPNKKRTEAPYFVILKKR